MKKCIFNIEYYDFGKFANWNRLILYAFSSAYETDGWTRAHNAIRGELSTMKGVIAYLGNKSLKDWEKASLKVAWTNTPTFCIKHQVLRLTNTRNICLHSLTATTPEYVYRLVVA